MLELRDRRVEIAAIERRTALGDVEAGAAGTIVRGRQLASFLQLGGGLVLPSGARQREAELIVRLAVRRLQPGGLLKRADRIGDLAVGEQCLAEREVGARERRIEIDHFLQLRDGFRADACVGLELYAIARLNNALTNVGASATARSSSRIASSGSVGVNAAPRFAWASA